MNICFSPYKHIGSSNLNSFFKTNSHKHSFHNTKKGKTIGKKTTEDFKPNNIFKNLMKQKEHLIDNKNSLMKRSLQKGEDPKTLKENLEKLDKQMAEIDKQINELKLKEQRKSIDTNDKRKKNKNSKQESKKNYTNYKKNNSSMDSIVDLSTNLKQSEALLSQKNLISSNAKVLDFEIQLDLKRGNNPVAKKKYLAKMKDNIKKITEKLHTDLKNLNLKASNDTQTNYSKDILKGNNTNCNMSIKKEVKDGDKLTIKQRQTAQNVKNYKDNIKDPVKDNGKKINIIS